MKKLIMATLSFCLSATLSSGASAADAENTESTKVDSSKNPITGTKKTTRTWTKKSKDAAGQGEAEVKETTKVKRDGSVEKKVEVDADSKHNGH